MTVLTPLKAIRAKCLDCCGGQAYEVRLCTVEKCALHPYRMGHRPKVDKSIDEESGDEKTARSSRFFDMDEVSEEEDEDEGLED